MWNSSNFCKNGDFEAAHVMRALWCGAQLVEQTPQFFGMSTARKNTWLNGYIYNIYVSISYIYIYNIYICIYNGRTDFSLCGVNPYLDGAKMSDAHFAWGVSSTRRSIHSCRKLNAQERFRVGTYPAIMGSWGGLPRKNMIQLIQSLKIFDAPQNLGLLVDFFILEAPFGRGLLILGAWDHTNSKDLVT